MCKFIYKSLCEQLDSAIRLSQHEDFHILGIFLYGSQNYQLDTPTSDIDTVVLCVPSLKRLILGKGSLSIVNNLPSGEKQVIWDLRHFFNSLKKQSSGSLELLCTDYKILTPGSAELLQPIFDNCNEIAKYDPARFKAHIWGSIVNELGRYSKGIAENTEYSVAYAHKSLSHALRYLDLYQALARDNLSLKDSQAPARLELIKAVKQQKVSQEQKDAVIREAEEFIANNKPAKPNAIWIPNSIDYLLEDVLIKTYTEVISTSQFIK